MLSAGEAFPDFRLPDQKGELLSRDDLRGQAFVVYLYPKDDTPGCTTEACEFRDQEVAFAGARVIGVSPDSVESHAKFVEKHRLPMTLLSDPDRQLISALGAWVEKNMYGKKSFGVQRSTFLVDREGIVKKVWPRVKPQGHAAQVLEAIRDLGV